MNEKIPIDNKEATSEEVHPLKAELVRRNMFCLHGITGTDLGLNNAVPPEITIEERFLIAVGLQPTISTAVYRHDTLSNITPLWGNVGVVVSDGEVKYASMHDAGTVIREGERITEQQTPEEMELQLDLIDEWQKRFGKTTKLNEVVVHSPEIAGLYLKDTSGLRPREINHDQAVGEPNHIPEILRNLSIELDLPVYAIRHTGLYKVNVWDENGRYNFVTGSERVDPGRP